MKKIISLLVIAAMALSLITVSAAEDKVEISFRVGDSTLSINGNDVSVEKPYVKDGVTLVPLRVITEAFGAEVEWIGETKTIKLIYPDVNISLVIGSNTAEINGRAETLLHEPELLPPGVTMVPLRFISETFGAEVSYDDATKAIKVVKEKLYSSSIIEGAIETAKIGDSYYKWTAVNPEPFKINYRDFAGMYTTFKYNDSNKFDIIVATVPEDYDQDKDFNAVKNSLKNYSLVKADKTSENNIKKNYFQIRNKNEFGIIMTVVNDKYVFNISGVADYTDKEQTDKLTEIAESFQTVWDGTDTYDLSEVKGGNRLFESEDMELSFNVPAEFYMTDEDTANEFLFVSSDRNDKLSAMGLDVYSLSSAGGAEALAAKDKSSNAKNFNEKLATLTEVVPAKYKNVSGYEYELTVSGSDKRDFYSKDFFFEKGDYVYNFHIRLKNTSKDEKKIAEELLDSLSVKELDSNKTGTLVRNESELDKTYNSKCDKWSVELPYDFSENYTGPDSGIFAFGDTVISINTFKSSDSDYQALRRALKDREAKLKNEKDVKMTQLTKNVQINEKSFAFLEYKKAEEDYTAYVQTYLGATPDGFVSFVIYIPEIYYSYFNLERINAVIKSFKTL